MDEGSRSGAHQSPSPAAACGRAATAAGVPVGSRPAPSRGGADLTFPKNIQGLFARHLEAKIRAKADLENARTAVATARALKNASELMKGDDNIRFFQFMETISKIAEKGRHTFLVGEFPQVPK